MINHPVSIRDDYRIGIALKPFSDIDIHKIIPYHDLMLGKNSQNVLLFICLQPMYDTCLKISKYTGKTTFMNFTHDQCIIHFQSFKCEYRDIFISIRNGDIFGMRAEHVITNIKGLNVITNNTYRDEFLMKDMVLYPSTCNESFYKTYMAYYR